MQPFCLQKNFSHVGLSRTVVDTHTHTHHSIANGEAKFKSRFLKNLNPVFEEKGCRA